MGRKNPGKKAPLVILIATCTENNFKDLILKLFNTFSFFSNCACETEYVCFAQSYWCYLSLRRTLSNKASLCLLGNEFIVSETVPIVQTLFSYVAQT